MAIDQTTIVRDGTLEFSNFRVVENATPGDVAGISDGAVKGSTFNDGLTFTDFTANAGGLNSRVDATVSYTVKQTDPLTAIEQIGAQFNIAVDIEGETVSFGPNGPSRSLGSIEARLVHSVYTVNPDGSKGELVGSITLDVRDPDFRDPPYETDDFLLENSYSELLVETRIVLDTNNTDARLSLSVIENTYDIGPAPVDPGTASLGDYVWFDTDKDGIQDAGEQGAAGVAVTLAGAGNDGVFGTADDISKTTTTDANGKYLFDNLNAGDYRVTFGTLAGYEFTTASAAAADVGATDSDARAGGVTSTVNLSVGEAERDVDAGLVRTDPGTASLGDYVWFDTDKDGIQDATERGAAGVAVTLAGAGADGAFGTADDISKTTTTDANGKYLFDQLDAGNYRVTFGTLPNYGFTKASTAAADAGANDSDAGVGGVTSVVNLSVGEAELDVDAGLIAKSTGTAKLGDTVWFDTNMNGWLDGGEKGAAGVTVVLTGAGADKVFGTADDTSATTTTDANGKYLFDKLDAGDYRVTFGTLPGYIFTTKSPYQVDYASTDSDAGVNGVTDTVTLSTGEAELDVDAGLININGGTASLGDTVWFDTNQNGFLDAGEKGAAGVTVELTGAGADKVFGTDDDLTRTTTTDANGKYLFDKLLAGEYKVTFGTLPGYQFTTEGTNAAGVVNNDSDAGPGGVTDTITVITGRAELDIDAGLIDPNSGTASLGDTVWFDANRNGRLDSTEKGAAGVTVELTGAGADKVFGTDDDITRTTTTDANGKYLFSNLAVGDYKVTFGSLPGYEFTTEGSNAADVLNNDSDAGAGGVTDTITLTYGEAERDVDAGLVALNSAINPDSVTLCEDKKETFNVLDNDGEGLKLVGVTHETTALQAEFVKRGGSITFDADGNVTYQGMTNYYGKDKLVYTVEDANGFRFTETVDVTLNSASDVVAKGGFYHPTGWSPSLTGTTWAHVYKLSDFGNLTDAVDKLQQFSNYNTNVADDSDTPVSIILTGMSKLNGWVVYNGQRLDFSNGQEYDIPLEDISAGKLQLDFNGAYVTHTLSWRLVDSGDSGGECGNVNESTITTTSIHTPIALDLNGDNKIGVTGETSSYDKSGVTEVGKTVQFDIDADGDQDTIEWLAGDGDAFLFDNRDGNAVNDMNGSRLFGGADGHANGYDKLAEFDVDADGMLRGIELEGLQLWADNGDGVLAEDEIVLLSDAGVTALSANMELVKDAEGRDLMQSFAELENGQHMLTEDVWFLQG